MDIYMSEKKYVAYVGTYTHGSSIGIHLYDVDVEEGVLRERKVVPVNNSSYLARSKSGKYLYSIADEGVAVFAIHADGDLEYINKVDIGGMRGCYLSVDETGKYLFVAGYHDGKVTVVHTHRDGRLGSVMDGVFHKGIGSVAERSFRPHVSCVIPTPDNKYLCAVDNGIDQVKIYRLDKRRHKLHLEDIVRCRRESGPREMRFSRSGKYAYLIYELSNDVDVFSYEDGSKGPVFEKVQNISILDTDLDPMHDAAETLAMSPDGHYLFASTAGDNSITMFAIDPENGQLERKFSLPISGEYPKSMKLFPDGKHIAIVNHESNSITTFTIDYEKNVLMMKGKPMSVDTPNCILIEEVSPENTI